MKAPDQAERDRAVRSRKNVVIDAGAGTGKTTTIVARLVECIAPADDTRAAMPLDRVAAITFTRRAAGELKLRVRESVLRALGEVSLTPVRRERLLDALGKLDAAYLGTIHSFADRLLRLRPVEARLSPSYAIAEDASDIVDAAFEHMLRLAQDGLLADAYAGRPDLPRDLLVDAERTIVDALQLGIRARAAEFDFAPPGLAELVARLINTRDRELPVLAAPSLDRKAFDAVAKRVRAVLRPVEPDGAGEKALIALRKAIEGVADPSPKALGELLRSVKRVGELGPRKDFKKGPGLDAFNALRESDTDDGPRLLDALVAPVHQWLAKRLVRLAPVAVAIYEDTKRQRQALDTIDLLLKLRDLLRDDLVARAEYQKLFDHIFVDEFQDTDPLQAEVLLYLCERAAKAKNAGDVLVAQGKLTIVGDPKQSIYRFRRADIAMYERTRAQIMAGEHDAVELRANFRSAPRLLDWLNERMEVVLGAGKGKTFDPATGQAFFQALEAGRDAGVTASVKSRDVVHVVPLEIDGEGENANATRALEGEAVAAYVRWLVDDEKFVIVDPETDESRPVRMSDIAVLARATSQLSNLFAAFDASGVPYAPGGGRLFLEDAIHKQFLLGLRAVVDDDDGGALAALYRPPFFAVDPWDMWQARAARRGLADVDAEAAGRGQAALDFVAELRRARGKRSFGETARRLLDGTAFARMAALGPNGAQRVRHLRELVFALERLADEEGLDFDGVAARAREWVDAPVGLDPAPPVGSDAVRVLTVHQAKGLEFPVVILWDAAGELGRDQGAGAFELDEATGAWLVSMQGFAWEEPAGSAIKERANLMAGHERRRLVYVAATRARDLFVLPVRPDGKFSGADKYVHPLIAGASPGAKAVKGVRWLDPYVVGEGARWSTKQSAPATKAPTMVRDVAEKERASWDEALREAMRPRFMPTSVTAEAKGGEVVRVPRDRAREEASSDDVPLGAGPSPEASEGVPPALRAKREGRFGPAFGSVVHGAIGLALTRKLSADEAVRRAARMLDADPDVVAKIPLGEAVSDVTRTLACLAREGIAGAAARGSAEVRLEYPFAEPTADGTKLVVGYVDLVAVPIGGRLVVLDFKTDRAPTRSAAEDYPAYVKQVRAYADVLMWSEQAPGVVAGLLFTETGRVEWCEG